MNENLPEAIGPYRIQSKLGQGGMGAVFKAIHDTLERPAAVKLLPPEMAQNPEYVSRFLREARTVATLNHPHIVQVYDAGAFEGRYFIAMELVEGTSLATYLDEKGKLSEAEGLRLLLQAARGLSVAHAKGLVHRDIKPENMLLDKDLNLHIVDFGLVMETASQTQLTATGACLGTPMYMSPEQTDGEKADARSDIYSLGVTFFRAVVGTPPFSSPTVMNLLFKHRFEAPPEPRTVRPELSENISNLLLTMMAKPREDRPQDGQALVKLIEDLQQGKKVPAPPPFRSPLTSTGLPAQNASGVSPSVNAPNRTFVFAGIAAAAIVILLIAGLVLWWLVWSGQPSTLAAGGGTPQTSSDPPGKKDPGTGGTKTTGNPAGFGTTERQRLMENARKLEAHGDLALAIVAYEQAAKLGTDEVLEAKLKSLKRQVEGPGNVQPDPEPGAADRDPGVALASEAQQLTVRGDYVQAAAKYEEASRVARRADYQQTYATRARDCQREGYLKEAEAADARQDWAGAATALSQALAITPDAAIQTRRETLLKKAKDESECRGYLRAGDAAMAKREFIPARVNYRLALQLNPTSMEAQSKLSEANGRVAIQAGDEARAKSDLTTARSEYNRAREFCPALKAEVDQRLIDLERQQFSTDQIAANIDRLVRDGRENEAYTSLTSSLRANPTDAQLLRLKEGLECLQACETLYRSLKPILQKGQSGAIEVRAIDSSDDQAARLRESMDGKALLCDTKYSEARTNFASRDNDRLRAMVTEAKTMALTAGGELEGASDRYRRKATEAADFKGLNIFGAKVGVKGDQVKADKYKRAADSFALLSQQARALSQ